jgi:aminoglycoside phosphotransferase (APT) family kinase protein
VAAAETRRFPLLEVGRAEIEALLSPLLGQRGVGSVTNLDDGLTNTLLRVVPADGREPLVVRIFGGGFAPWAKEQATLREIGGALPVPHVLLADDGRSAFPWPALVYRWIDGITLNACRRQVASSELLSLAEPLGKLLADVASCRVHLAGGEGTAPEIARWRSAEELLLTTSMRLESGRARQRLRPPLADAIRRRLELAANDLELGPADHLVHGDLGGRNILVAPESGARWRVAGLIDWESACLGWAVWDVASLFRYPRRFSAEFQTGFERGYRGAGGSLPAHWWQIARLLDAARQVGTLDEVEERPCAFAECVELLGALVSE